MSETTNKNIQRASRLDGESVFLDEVVDDLTDSSRKLVYADWLEEQGDVSRATFLRDFVKASESMNVKDFPKSKKVPPAWTQMIGAELVRAIAEEQLGEHRDKWLALAKPALKYELARPSGRGFKGDDFPIGGTKLFGLPDLPPGSKWPQQKDCNTFYDPDSGIEPETFCGFVCQINLADFAGTQAARLFPSKGLLSIFSCAEINSIGMVDGYVVFTPMPGNLVRLEAPEDIVGSMVEDEANEVLNPRSFSFSEVLEIPYGSDSSPFEDVKFGYSHELSGPYSEVRHKAGVDGLESMLGYTRATSGDDPLPGPEWCKLICLPNTIEMMLHFCIKRDDLASGQFDNVKLAWVDFD